MCRRYLNLIVPSDGFAVTLVLFRTRRGDECSRLKESLRRRVRKSRQKEAAGVATRKTIRRITISYF